MIMLLGVDKKTIEHKSGNRKVCPVYRMVLFGEQKKAGNFMSEASCFFRAFFVLLIT